MIRLRGSTIVGDFFVEQVFPVVVVNTITLKTPGGEVNECNWDVTTIIS
jgi:hypothetical protein